MFTLNLNMIYKGKLLDCSLDYQNLQENHSVFQNHTDLLFKFSDAHTKDILKAADWSSKFSESFCSLCCYCKDLNNERTIWEKAYYLGNSSNLWSLTLFRMIPLVFWLFQDAPFQFIHVEFHLVVPETRPRQPQGKIALKSSKDYIKLVNTGK